MFFPSVSHSLPTLLLCHTDFSFPVPPLASVRLCVRNLATRLICTMAKLVSHVIRTLGEGFQEEELQIDSEFPSAGKMQLDRGDGKS